MALVVAAALVWQSAYAGFADQTAALSASVGTGTVAVTSNVEVYSSVALTLSQLKPGDSGSQCIVITSTGSARAQVRLYGRDRTGNSGVAGALTLSWTPGTGGGADGDCTGFVPTGTSRQTPMSSFPTTYGGGYLPWDTAGGVAAESRTYRLVYTVASNPPVSIKGASAALTFVWEAQNR